jgi:acyl-coenzyme A synthetase/AMP-(fatty) acid ligase
MKMQSIPHMFFARAASRGQRPAQLVKRGDTWPAISWQAMSDNVRNIAKGWLTLGLQMGDRVALLANSRAEWVQCDLGIMAVGGTTVPDGLVSGVVADFRSRTNSIVSSFCTSSWVLPWVPKPSAGGIATWGTSSGW